MALAAWRFSGVCKRRRDVGERDGINFKVNVEKVPSLSQGGIAALESRRRGQPFSGTNGGKLQRAPFSGLKLPRGNIAAHHEKGNYTETRLYQRSRRKNARTTCTTTCSLLFPHSDDSVAGLSIGFSQNVPNEHRPVIARRHTKSVGWIARKCPGSRQHSPLK